MKVPMIIYGSTTSHVMTTTMIGKIGDKGSTLLSKIGFSKDIPQEARYYLTLPKFYPVRKKDKKNRAALAFSSRTAR